MLESIRSAGGILSRTIGFGLPLRLLLGAILGALGGSTFLGVISEFAGYSYAIHYGVRPPLEGIPYLRASVTLLTISVFFLGAIAFLAVYLLGHAWTKLFSLLDKIPSARQSNGATVQDIREWPLKRRLIHILTLSVPLTLTLTSTAFWHPGFNFEGSPFTFGASVFITLIVLYTILYSPNTIRWIALISTLLVFVVAPVFLFHAHQYGSLLRFIGYGGGLHVQVTYIEPQPEALREIKGALVLRTSEAIIVYDPEQRVYREIPIQTVRSISHRATNLAERYYVLPHYTTGGS